MSKIYKFASESNAIEGIHRPPTEEEIEVHKWFLELPFVQIEDVKLFVKVVAKASIRDASGKNVTVGGHLPPLGGPLVVNRLYSLLARISSYHDTTTPYEAHCEYELLHPFMDGNGRSGRVLWAWMMKNHGLDPFARPFLQYWYYQCLDAARYQQPNTTV